ncbi:hypothetical protein L2E82_19732 [Cichorium intybus]|uniref:Uncharacterized protein n=1 Tax=Cichorium intybus TaxID=13427 RepID=A0ACB9FDE9_CICIN|nr:hypothetical protein L2E82_19732 [Cichorium intybus]
MDTDTNCRLKLGVWIRVFASLLLLISKVDMVVLTDGSRILGLDDLGVQRIGISTGKLDMYVAAAGINPQRGIGISTGKLDMYVAAAGINPQRGIGISTGKLDMYVAAAGINPQRFEDFQFKWAFQTLQRYRMKFLMFNDDIQGTTGVALAGLFGTVTAQGQPLSEFVNQKIVVVGAVRI